MLYPVLCFLGQYFFHGDNFTRSFCNPNANARLIKYGISKKLVFHPVTISGWSVDQNSKNDKNNSSSSSTLR